MADIIKREKARMLRKKGKSLNEIAHALGANKSTVSYWCRDVRLTKKQQEKLLSRQKNAGIAAFIQAANDKHEIYVKNITYAKETGEKRVGNISKRDLFFIGAALYWGEGYKRGTNEIGFTNSDPDIVRTFLVWLFEIYEVKKEDLILRVSINKVHKKREKQVLAFWSRVTGVSLKQFTKTSFIQSKVVKKYHNHQNHFGTLRVKVRKGSLLRGDVLGSIEKIADQVTSQKTFQ